MVREFTNARKALASVEGVRSANIVSEIVFQVVAF